MNVREASVVLIAIAPTRSEDTTVPVMLGSMQRIQIYHLEMETNALVLLEIYKLLLNHDKTLSFHVLR